MSFRVTLYSTTHTVLTLVEPRLERREGRTDPSCALLAYTMHGSTMSRTAAETLPYEDFGGVITSTEHARLLAWDLAVLLPVSQPGVSFCVRRTRKIKAHVFFSRDACWRGSAQYGVFTYIRRDSRKCHTEWYDTHVITTLA